MILNLSDVLFCEFITQVEVSLLLFEYCSNHAQHHSVNAGYSGYVIKAVPRQVTSSVLSSVCFSPVTALSILLKLGS